MTNSELVFIMGNKNPEEQKVLSLRMLPGTKSGRPSNMPKDSPIY